MSFLAPVWLGLLAAAAVPIALHLMRRRHGVRVDFPAVRFLLRAEQEHRRELKLRNLALMLLRVAIIATLAFAAARPLVRVGGAGHAPTALALVVDNSLSASAVGATGAPIEVLRGAGARILDAATRDDRIWVLTADGAVVTGDAGAARAALGRVQPFSGRGDLVAAVERAASLVRGSGLAAGTVVVLTDGQASAWPRAARVADVVVSVVPAGLDAPANHFVRAARAEPARWAPRGAVAISVASAESLDVRVALGDRTIARSQLGPDAALSVRGSVDRDGWRAGRVELPADDLRGDDARYFAVFGGPIPSVRVDASAGAFARGAIETLAAAQRVALGGGVAVTGADGIMRRPAVAFAPSDPVRVGAANRALAAAGIPWRFGAMSRDAARVVGGPLDGVQVHTRYELIPTAASASDTLVIAGGAPWCVAGEGFVLVASPLDPAATSLPLAAPLLGWLETQIARYLLSDGGMVIEAAPGAATTLPAGVDELVSDADAGARPVRARTIDAPVVAGVYWLRRAGAIVGALVVNPEPEESDLARLTDADLARHVDGSSVRILRPDDGVARATFATSTRRPLLGTLLLALSLLIAAEAIIARPPARPTA